MYVMLFVDGDMDADESAVDCTRSACDIQAAADIVLIENTELSCHNGSGASERTAKDA